MRKKKNRNMTIMAGLLITPAIIVQASPVQANETSVNVENFTHAIDTFLTTTPPRSLATLNTAVNKVKTAYGKLTNEEKAALTSEIQKSYDKILATYTIVKGIDELSKKVDTAANLDAAITATVTNYNQLEDETYKGFIFNYTTLTNLAASVEQVLTIEQQIEALTPANMIATIPEVMANYAKLTAVQKKYISAPTQIKITSWSKTYTDATQIIKDIDAISTTPFATWGAATEASKATTLKQFNTKIIDTLAKLDKITLEGAPADVNAKALVTNYKRLLALKDFVDIAVPVLELNTDLSRVAETVQAAKRNVAAFDVKLLTHKNDLTAIDAINLPKLRQFLDEYLEYIENEQAIIVEVEALIDSLKTEIDLVKMTKAREKYNALSAEGKKFVSNINQLNTLETTYRAALAVISQIDTIDPTARDFVNKVTTAKASYDRLPSEALKQTVTNYPTLDAYLPVVTLMKEIDAIRINSADYKAQYDKAKSDYKVFADQVPANPTSKLDLAKQRLVTEYGPKLDKLEFAIQSIDSMIARIEALAHKTGQSFMTELKKLTEEYKRLDAASKSKVTNAGDLTKYERDYNVALKVIDLIEQLPSNTDAQFSKKVTAAETAYQKLTASQKGNVYNYSKLSQSLIPAKMIERINKLKTSSKTYDADVNELLEQYNALSAAEKNVVYNIDKLQEAKENMNLAAKVIELINAAVPTAEDYLTKLREAREAYDKLNKTRQPLISNYKDLVARERAMKPILKLDADILNLDPSNAKTFISKYKSAFNAYEKLGAVERKLLENGALLVGELKELYDVINTISLIKSSSKTYVNDTQKARNMYNTLKPELQEKVSNIKVLTDHELNVAGGAIVDAMIRNLASVDASRFIEAVKEVREAYNSLNATNKKAVTLIDELVKQEKYIKQVEKVIEEIEGLLNPRNNLAKQFEKVNKSLQKLDGTQYTYITNMHKYSNLGNVIHVYDLIEKLKPSDPYYQGNLEAAKIAYDRLSQEEKQKVTNYYKLQEAQVNVDEAKVVVNLIASLTPSASTYVEDVANASAAYKALASNLRKQVTNYNTLKQAEADLKAVDKVIKQIAAIDRTAKNAVSKVKSAKAAYDKLTNEQKALVTNYLILQAAIYELELTF